MTDWRDVANFVRGPNGQRPPLDDLPSDTPPAIVDMIKYCWHHDRTERLSAMQCLVTVHQCRDIFANKVFDIFLSYQSTEKYFVRYLYKLLVNSGYCVWNDENDIGHDMAHSMQRGIERSKVVLACVSPAYQNSDYTIFELRHASKYVDAETGLHKPVITVVLEKDFVIWADDELKCLCDIQNPDSRMYVDLSSVAIHYPRNVADAKSFQVSQQ